MSELLYYQVLATHLGLLFVQGPLALAPLAKANVAIRNGCAPFAGRESARWLLAPTGSQVLWLLARRALGRPVPGVLITTPTRLSALVRQGQWQDHRP